MNISVPIGHEVDGVAFSFCSSQDIRKISVKALNNPVTYDPATSNPNKNGLYDPALGPVDKQQMCVFERQNASLTNVICSCETCNLSYFECPGHFGHIELAVAVYHPLLFRTLFGLLRSKCAYCHCLRMKTAKVG
jgi:DNA-directed RNA polymerase I subunit RPA1